jgi:hypothetical protein
LKTNEGCSPDPDDTITSVFKFFHFGDSQSAGIQSELRQKYGEIFPKSIPKSPIYGIAP